MMLGLNQVFINQYEGCFRPHRTALDTLSLGWWPLSMGSGGRYFIDNHPGFSHRGTNYGCYLQIPQRREGSYSYSSYQTLLPIKGSPLPLLSFSSQEDLKFKILHFSARITRRLSVQRYHYLIKRFLTCR